MFSSVSYSTPSIALSSPFNNQNFYTKTITFNYTPYDYNNIKYCEIWTNDSGLFKPVLNNTNITKGVDNSFLLSFNNDGYLLWDIKCFDQAGGFSSSNRTIYISILNKSSTGVMGGKGLNETKGVTMSNMEGSLIFWVFALVIISITIKSTFFRRK